MPTSLRQHLLLTCLPRGLAEDGSLLTAVLVSPRLYYGGTPARLEDFADWLAWGDQSLSWGLSLDGGKHVVEAEVVSSPVEGLWGDVFRAEVPVTSWKGTAGPARSFLGFTYDTLADAALAGLAQPLLQGSAFGKAAAKVGAIRPGRHSPQGQPSTDVAEQMSGLLGFYEPGGRREQVGRLEPDFHERLSLVADHGPLLEALGLVWVLSVPAPALAANAEKTVSVQARLDWTPPSGVPVSFARPFTRAVVGVGTRAGWYAARLHSTGRLSKRLSLRLDDTARYRLHTGLDAEAASAQAVALTQGKGGSGTPPAARSAGLVLTERGRMAVVQEQHDRARQHAAALLPGAPTPPTLYAEDLLSGFHLQVREGVGATAPWRGLGHRSVTYGALDRRGGFTAVDEAAITLAARRAKDSSPDTLLVSDVAARWDGWSLAVPRPGRQLMDTGGSDELGADQGRPDNTWLTMSTALAETAADGSDGRLPSLRFGTTYRMRARAVDLAGGAIAWERSGPTTPATTYQRFEPAAAPLLVPPSSLTPGETASTLVVRSDPRAEEEPGQASFRTLVPARVGVEFALQHGVFDGEDGVPTAASWNQIATLDRRTVPPAWPVGAAAPAGGEPVALPVDWLPDPVVTRMAVRIAGLPRRDVSFLHPAEVGGTGAASLGAWQSVGFQVRGLPPDVPAALHEAEDGEGQRVVRLDLPPAWTRLVSFYARPIDEHLGLMGLYPQVPASSPAQRAQKVAQGQAWAVTPPVFAIAVHAVKRPLSDPSGVKTALVRQAGEKDPLLFVTADVDRASTGRGAVVASWEEEVDAGARALDDPRWAFPDTRLVQDNVVVEAEVPFAAKPTLGGLPFAARVPLPDLRRRTLRLRVVGSSRWIQEFREDATEMVWDPDGTGGRVLRLPSDVDVESVVVLLEGAELVRGRDLTRVLGTPGKPTLRLAAALADQIGALTVRWVRGAVTASSGEVEVDVPSAVTPEPPQPLYAVPAFGGTSGRLLEDGSGYADRGASKVRIFLERPWWTSGEGERLAVVTGLYPFPSDQDFDRLGHLVTTYGEDPAVRTTGAAQRYADLPGGTLVKNVGAVELPGAVVTRIRTFEVRYDSDRDVYYCDVPLPEQPAGTFVRLAVARFQPKVAKGLSRLSKIVALDPIQMLPKRTVAVTRNHSTLTVAVGGKAHRGAGKGLRPQVRASIQRKVQGHLDVGWETLVSRAVPAGESGGTYPSFTVDLPTGLGPEPLRVLIEEQEVWVTRDADGAPVPHGYAAAPADGEAAKAGLTARRPLWVATTPVPGT